MAFAQGSSSGLSYIKETTFGTTPVGNFISIPYKTHGLTLSKDVLDGQDITGDRMNRISRHGNRQVGGDFAFDLRKGDYDAILAAAMFGSWSTDTLKTGTTLSTFTFQDAATDISQYILYTGCGINSLSVSMAPNKMIECTANIVGSDQSISGTGKTLTASSTNEPFDAYSGDLEVGNTGGALATIANVTSLEFTINNSMAPTFVIGSDATPQLEYGRSNITGNLTAYFEDTNWLNRFRNETETAIQVTVDDPTGLNTYTFFFPRVKINSANTGVANEQSRLVEMEFTALYDASEGSDLTVTRTS